MAEGKSGATGKSADSATDALTEAGKKAAENSGAISLKMIDHAETNTREAFAAMRAAAKASSLAEVLRIQGDFIRDQGVRSMTLAREVGEMIVQFGKESLDPSGKG
ncbi:phasin family protein [Sphingomonas cavernae]|uniref:Phasin family protein n=1 Tax=Sphingomonas cavernae TaxID=2320861 RepID=A0A418WRW2_9SPHN|nr:phasin family protein [Sphingomonas cavernae]RJF94000.1 phasin family protein [Sphingomonas cavernae]